MKSMRFEWMRRQRGSALPLALAMLLVFSILGVSVARYVSQETLSDRQTQNFLQGRYLAEAGVEQALFQTKKNLQTISSTYDWINNPAGFDTSVLPDPPTDWIPLDLNYDTTSDTTTYSDTYSYSYGAKAFSIKGKFRWDYADPTPTIHWVAHVSGSVIDKTTFPTDETPDSIYFDRTFIGTGVLILPDGTQLTRKIKVGARISFLPMKTPDSPVYITTTEWEDIN